jgi:probable rRNA maturation factor
MTDPGHTIWISNRQTMVVDEDGLVDLAAEVLSGERVEHCELSVSLVDDHEMESLHVRYMNEPGPTDVLSFAQNEGEEGARLLGDVVIDPAEAARNSPSDPASEVRLLLVHGILHLLGYDHEEERGRTAMWARQERYSGVATP